MTARDWIKGYRQAVDDLEKFAKIRVETLFSDVRQDIATLERERKTATRRRAAAAAKRRKQR